MFTILGFFMRGLTGAVLIQPVSFQPDKMDVSVVECFFMFYSSSWNVRNSSFMDRYCAFIQSALLSV